MISNNINKYKLSFQGITQQVEQYKMCFQEVLFTRDNSAPWQGIDI